MSTLADLAVKIGVDNKGVGKGLGDTESKFQKTFKKVEAAAAIGGAAIGVALVAGLGKVLEQSKTDALLAAQLGAPAGLAEDLGKATGDLFKRGVVSSYEDAAAAVRAVWQNALVSDDATGAEVEAVAAKVSNLGMILEEDAGRVSGAVSQMLRTGVADSAEEAFDLLTRGAQQGLNKSGDLLDTFNEYGTQFRKLGLDGPAALGLISQAIQAGARDSDVAADALKEFSIRAIDGSKATASGFQALGLDAGKMAAQIAAGGPAAAAGLDTVLDRLRGIEDPVKRDQAAVALFGTKAEDLGAALLAMDVTSAADGLGDVAGAADKAGQSLEESAGAKLERLKRTIQQTLVDKLAEAVPYIEGTFGWLQKNSGWVTPLATGLGILAVVIGTIIVATKIWTAVQTAFNIVMALNPIALVVIAILALVAAVVWIATKTDWFQRLWAWAWGGIKAAALAVARWFSGPFVGFFTGAWDKIKSWTSSAINWFKGLPGKMRSALSGLWDGVKSSFRSAINWVIGKWNNFSLTLGGGSVLGIGIPSVTLNTPNIPYLADGGIIPATPGGRLAVLGEGGQDEAVVPLPRGMRDMRGGAQELTIRVAPGGDPALRELIVRGLLYELRTDSGSRAQLKKAVA